MASSPIFSSMSLFFLLVLQVITSNITSTETCKVRYCSRSGPPIRFPFRIRKLHGKECGHKGFEVSCDDRNRTILHLSGGGNFVVDPIDYTDQYILMKDPDGCLPERLLVDQFIRASLPFLAPDYKSFALANCSSANFSTIPESVVRLDCIGRAGHMVVVAVKDYVFARPWMLKHHCDYLTTISSPWRPQRPTNISEGFWLRWINPIADRAKQPKRDANSDIALLFMLPWLVCIVGLAWFFKVRGFGGLGQVSSNNVPSSASSSDVFGQAVEMTPRNAVGATGISSPTIESYPQTQIDEPGQLPRPNDDVCTICLSKYEQKEMIRTIPECEHYFHAYCIDQWLRKNASCPLCRNYKG